jgi:hypothetical protein
MAVTFLNIEETLSCIPRRLYCFHCDDYFQHVLFLQEEGRLVLKAIVLWMAWTVDEKAPDIKKSFDSLRFVRIPDVGIYWNGFQATYPIEIPRQHLLASRVARLRYQLVR